MAQPQAQVHAPVEKTQIRDPTQFFLNQHNEISEDKKKLAYEFAAKLLNNDNCPTCKAPYNLNDHVPKILVQCGHTICFFCMQMFFRDGSIRCPICLKLHKKLPSIEVLPTNHTIHAKLMKITPKEHINHNFERLILPADMIAALPPRA